MKVCIQNLNCFYKITLEIILINFKIHKIKLKHHKEYMRNGVQPYKTSQHLKHTLSIIKKIYKKKNMQITNMSKMKN